MNCPKCGSELMSYRLTILGENDRAYVCDACRMIFTDHQQADINSLKAKIEEAKEFAHSASLYTCDYRSCDDCSEDCRAVRALEWLEANK